MVNVAVVGLGHWGPNLARNIEALSEARLHTLCDHSSGRLEEVGRRHRGATLVPEYKAVLGDSEVDAVMLATPAASHHEMGLQALRAGKDLFVEKPLARTYEEGEELVAVAADNDRVLMVGHVFLYNAAVRKVKEYIDSGELGEIYYVYSQRLNLGRLRQDVNALWNFAPHDISIICYWLDSSPQQVTARGYSYIQQGIEDVVFATLDFPGGIGANCHISWLDPNKVRRMTVVGSEKMVVYDDVSQDAKVKVYEKGVVKQRNNGASFGAWEDYGEWQLLTRAGDVMIPKIDFVEPLRTECQEFVHSVRERQRPLTDGRNGVEVVSVLEAVDKALKEPGLVPVKASPDDALTAGVF